MRVSEIRVKRIRVNQGLGVLGRSASHNKNLAAACISYLLHSIQAAASRRHKQFNLKSSASLTLCPLVHMLLKLA